MFGDVPLSEPTEPASPIPPKRIFWRQGTRRIFVVLSALYFGLWAIVGVNWIADHPFLVGQPLVPSTSPLRQLSPIESQNPRVTQLLSLVSARPEGGIAYNRELLRRWLADQERPHSRELPDWQSDMINQTTRRFAAERVRYVMLPDPRGDLVAYPATMTLPELKDALEETHAGWRWPIHSDYSGSCLLDGAYN